MEDNSIHTPPFDVIFAVDSLSSGRVVLSYSYQGSSRVALLNLQGLVQEYTCQSSDKITGVLYSSPWLYIIQIDGTITKIQEDLSPRGSTVNQIKHHHNVRPGQVLETDVLLLLSASAILTYNLETNTITQSVQYQNAGVVLHNRYLKQLKGKRGFRKDPLYLLTSDNAPVMPVIYDSVGLLVKFSILNKIDEYTPNTVVAYDSHQNKICEYFLDGKLKKILFFLQRRQSEEIKFSVNDKDLWILRDGQLFHELMD